MRDTDRKRAPTAIDEECSVTSIHRLITDGGVSYGPLFDTFPDPLIAYGRGADDDVVRSINPAFEAVFDVEPAVATGGRSIERVLVETIDSVLDASHSGSSTPWASASDASTAATNATRESLETPSKDVEDTLESADSSATGETTEIPVTKHSVARILDRLHSTSATSFVVCFRAQREPRYFRLRHVPVTDRERVLVFTELTGEKRREAELEATVRRLERITGVAAHDLRNPLDVAMIRLEVARETGDNAHLDNVELALDRIQHIVDDVLSVGSHRVDPPETVPLAEVARAAWSTVETGDVTLTIEPDLPTVRGELDRLQRLFENLFRNSVHHAGTDVAVSVGPTSEGFYVADDGPGIRSKARARVFEPGYSTDDDSSGLGLAIVEQISAEHGWNVTLAADTDGVRFEFTGVSSATPEE